MARPSTVRQIAGVRTDEAGADVALADAESLPRELLIEVFEMMHEHGQGGYDAGLMAISEYRRSLRAASEAFEAWAGPAQELLRSICVVRESSMVGDSWTTRCEVEEGSEACSVRILALERGVRAHALSALPIAGEIVRFVGPAWALNLLPLWPRLAVASVDASTPLPDNAETALAAAPTLRRLALDGTCIGRTKGIALGSIRALSYTASFGRDGESLHPILAMLPHITTLKMSGVTISAFIQSVTRPASSAAEVHGQATSDERWLHHLAVLDVAPFKGFAPMPDARTVAVAYASLPNVRVVVLRAHHVSDDSQRCLVGALTSALYTVLPVLERVEVVNWRKVDTAPINQLRAICRLRGVALVVSFAPGASGARECAI